MWEAKAEKGEELLNQMISMDEGAAYLGECALVPYDSPIVIQGLFSITRCLTKTQPAILLSEEVFQNV